MFRSELYKIRKHRTPLVLTLILLTVVLAPPTWMLFSAPSDTAAYREALVGVYSLAVLLVAVVFGGWMAGHEYRQGTMRRVVAIDARRGRLLLSKASAGLASLIIALVAAAAVSWVAAWAVAQGHGFDMAGTGIARELLAVGVFALLAAAMTFSLSIIARSDVYAMLSTFGVIVMFGPLLELIPKIGKYVPSAAFNRVTDSVGGLETLSELSLATGVVTTVTYLAAAGLGAIALFRLRDI